MPLLQVEVHPEAYNELEQSRLWYENQAKDLGFKFLNEVELAINTIRQFPDIWSPYCEETQRFLLHRFPFAIVYRHKKNKIQVFAIMHLRRKPGYWKDRRF
ncbi:type II toxin-antitoxin system RelE/ParE family toxin [Candidatus Desantisbacteria bacterium]|nr:type II toxin-antitoxin system RelE/ParE family toxin [Candidatus Desantisbacteria bacterium]